MPAVATAPSESSESVSTRDPNASKSAVVVEVDDLKVGFGKNSVVTTAAIIVADVVGAGILGMPLAVAKFGWLLGAVVMIVMMAANVHISLLLWRAFMHCSEGNPHTYLELAGTAFARAPSWQRRLVVFLTGMSQMAFIFGMLGLYILSSGRGLGMVMFNTHLCLPSWAAIACAVIVPFASSAREMGTYKSLVWINVLTLVGAVLIPLADMLARGIADVRMEDSGVYAVEEMSWQGVLFGLGSFTFGMTSQFMLTEIIAEMKNPEKLPQAYVKISAPFQLVAFLVAGLGGYCFVGNKISGMIDENIPFNMSFRWAAGCMVIHMIVSYLIKGVVFVRSLQKAFDPEYADFDDHRSRAWLSWVVLVLLTLACAWFLANVVPFFGDAVNILGSSFTPLSCWVMPIVIFGRVYYDAGQNKPKVTKLEWSIMALEMSLALVLMIFGTYSAIATLVEEWHTYGYPFECHCEGLWKTCACSAAHVGMEEQCAATAP